MHFDLKFKYRTGNSVALYPLSHLQALDILIDYTNVDVAGHNYLIHASRFIHHPEHKDKGLSGKKKFQHT
ncbi:MAG: hypothetical protein WC620_07760 [Methanoregula sp.]|jgi:hypothetical protein